MFLKEVDLELRGVVALEDMLLLLLQVVQGEGCLTFRRGHVAFLSGLVLVAIKGTRCVVTTGLRRVVWVEGLGGG